VSKISDIEWNMNIAIEQAMLASKLGEVPVGAVVVDGNNKMVSQAHNLKEMSNRSHAHAEILALEQAAKINDNWRLTDHSLFVTLEPCPMCMHALLQYRIKKLYFAAYDPKGGSLSLGYPIGFDKRLNHQLEIQGGILHYKASELLSVFFKQRRNEYKISK
jgi:tRNA(adenine34) deaminase